MKGYEWVTRIKKETELNSDNKVAIAIGVTRALISDHKHGRAKVFGDETCMKIASLLNIPPQNVIADQHAEGAKDPELRKVWQEIAKTISQSAASFSIFATLLAASFSAPQYILCKIEEFDADGALAA